MTLLEKAIAEVGIILKSSAATSPQITHATVHLDTLRELYEAAAKYSDLCD
jgi:hypothetical protein